MNWKKARSREEMVGGAVMQGQSAGRCSYCRKPLDGYGICGNAECPPAQQDSDSFPQGHIDSGRRCLVAHFGEQGQLLDTCIRCATCNEWIRPENWGGTCPGKPSAPGSLKEAKP